MRVLVVGSGGREHAICAAFRRSPRVHEIFCAPGNAGISEIAQCVALGSEETAKLADFAEANKIDLTFVGGETSLALGIVDIFTKRGLKIIGPTGAAARLEASKSFAKDFMSRHGVPTAAYETADSPEAAVAILDSGKFGGELSPVVVKADGLAAGKGVVVASHRAEAIAAVRAMGSLVGTAAAHRIVLEECLIGREVSLLMFADGRDHALMPLTRDHKRLGEGDTGPNTGGMGTITDAGLLTSRHLSEVVSTIIQPTLAGCIDDGFWFRGIMFLGLMITENGPRLLEYNVRFGDPETQAILVRLESDIADICEAMLDGGIKDLEIKWKPGNSACVILAAAGYPLDPRKGDVISGLKEAEAVKDVAIFHSGTGRNAAGKLITSGGRVLGVTATDSDLTGALAKAYTAVGTIHWPGSQFRRDIGK